MRLSARLGVSALALSVLAACTPAPAAPTPGASPTPTPVSTPEPAHDSDSLRMTRDAFPVLNGSTSTAPLARAVCASLLGEDLSQVSDLVNFSKTTASYRALMGGNADLLIAAEPAGTVVAEMEEEGFEAEMAPIATDALVFLVNEQNPVDSLTADELRGIYTGAITNWKEVGGEDRPILPFQRNAEAGSQTLMKKLVMGDTPLMEAPKDYTVSSMEGLIEAVRSFDGSPGAIGYTVYYYANDMNMADGLKVLSVDGAAPSAGSIRSGAYPFTNPYYAVVSADAPTDSPARQVFDWLQGPVGQSLIQHEGYVSILEHPAQVDWNLGETEPLEEVYTRLSPDPLPALVPSKDYGELLSYVGAVLPGEYYDFERYGLVTRDGMIVVDPVYDSVYALGMYTDASFETWEELSVYALGQTLPVGPGGAYEKRYALAAQDGSWCTGFDYLYTDIVDLSHIWAVEPDGTGVMLDASAKELWRIPLPPGEEVWYFQGGMVGNMYWRGGVGVVYGQSGQSLVNLQGELTSSEGLGWVDLQSFSEGLAAALDAESGLWGYVSPSAGAWAIPAAYSSARDFRDGKAIVDVPDGSTLVIDPRGNVLWETNHGRMTEYRGGGLAYFCHCEDQVESSQIKVLGLYDQDLKEVPSGAVGRVLYAGNSCWMWEETDAGTRLWSIRGSVDIPARGFLNAIQDDLLIFIQDREDGATLWSVYTLGGKELLPPTAADYVGLMTDTATGEDYYYVQQDGRFDLCDAAGKVLVTASGYPQLQNGLLSSQDERSFGYQTLDGEWVFRISLAKSQGD